MTSRETGTPGPHEVGCQCERCEQYEKQLKQFSGAGGITEMDRYQLNKIRDTEKGKELEQKRADLPLSVRLEIHREYEEKLRLEIGDDMFEYTAEDPGFLD